MSGQSGVLGVIFRHVESHWAMAGSDAYSAQEAPKLEKAYSALSELIEACEALKKYPDDTEIQGEFCTALARVKGESA